VREFSTSEAPTNMWAVRKGNASGSLERIYGKGGTGREQGIGHRKEGEGRRKEGVGKASLAVQGGKKSILRGN